MKQDYWAWIGCILAAVVVCLFALWLTHPEEHPVHIEESGIEIDIPAHPDVDLKTEDFC